MSILSINRWSLEFSLTKIDETRNDLLEEVKHNDLPRKSIQRHVSIYVLLSTGLFLLQKFSDVF